jgi:hypothetical protein
MTPSEFKEMLETVVEATVEQSRGALSEGSIILI